MARRTYSLRPQCAADECSQRAFYEHTSRADYDRHARELQQRPWRCIRHTKPDEVLALDNVERVLVLVASRVPSRSSDGYLDGLFWLPEGEGTGSGFTHGPGFKAYATDFPEGTRLVVTARVLPPAKNEQHPCPTDGCPGDARYAAPGRLHREGCTYPLPPAEGDHG